MFKKIKQLFKRAPKFDLKEKCIEEYGEEFGEIYENLNRGIPVGGFLETAAILSAIEEVRKKYKIK